MKKYERGYLPKIEYWRGYMISAIESLDEEAIKRAASKLEYFVGKQNSTYGGPLKGDDFLRSVGIIK